MSASLAQQLAEFTVETTFGDLPSQVAEATKVYLLDDFTAGIAGAHRPWTRMTASVAQQQGSAGQCSIFGHPWKTSPSYAALVNGVAVGGFECDHVHISASAHPGAAVFPTALALGEQLHLDGASFTTAMALGYEVLCRVGLAATRAVEDRRGFHGPGTNAPFGAAVAAGKALSFDASQMTNAIGIAGSHSAGLLEFAHEGAMTKRLHVGRGGQMGLESALFASRGFSGPSTVLEGKHGFLNVYSPEPRLELVTEDLGVKFKMLDVTLKAYPCHISAHPILEVASRLRREQTFDSKDIGTVRITGNPWMMEPRFCQRRPDTLMGAQYSLPFAMSIALLRGLDNPSSMSTEALADPAVRALADRIDLGKDGSRFSNMGGAAAELSITIAGESRTLVALDWKGTPTNPCLFSDAADKFRRYAVDVPSHHVEELIARVAGIEAEPDVATLARLIVEINGENNENDPPL